MADARRRARRPDAVEAAPAASPQAASPPEAAAPPEAVGARAVHPAPDAPAGAMLSGERIELPASGLAEDILRQLGAAPAPAEPPPPAAARIELPASGLAEDILPREEAPAPVPAGPPAARDAHNLSFFAAPVKEQRAAVEATEHLATFFLDREEYGVDVRQVQEIRRVTEITTVPRAPEFIRGVINLRGRILPVLDLKRKLGLGDVTLERATRIVVVRVHERRLGLLVDGASQVLKVPVSQIEPAPEEVVDRGGDYIRGVAKLDDRLIILIELERALAHELRAAAAVVAVAGAREVGAPDGVS